MADLIQYGAASAVYLDKRLKRDARAIKSAGAGGRKSIVDGYIVTTSVSAEGTLTKVVDTPAFLALGHAAQVRATGPVNDLMLFSLGYRDNYLVNATAPATKLLDATAPATKLLDATVARQFYVTGYNYVGADVGYPSIADAVSTLLSNSWADGEYAYGGRVSAYEDLGLGRDVGHIVLHGVRWSTSSFLLSEGVGSSDPSAAKERVLVIEEAAVRAAAGNAGLTLAPTTASGISVVPVLRSVVLGDSAFIATTAYDLADGIDATLFVARVEIPAFDPDVRNRPASFAWTRTLVEPPLVAPPAVPALTIPSSSGLHASLSTVTAGMSFNWTDTPAVTASGISVVPALRARKTVLYAVDAVTGALNASTTIAKSASPDTVWDYVWFSSALEAGLTFVRYDYEHDYDTGTGAVSGNELRMAVGTSVVSGNMLGSGWVPWYRVLPGVIPSVAALVLAYPSQPVCDLGGGRIGVIACAKGSYTSGAIVTWHLIELEAATLNFVADRGAIGGMTYSPLTNQRVSITVVTPQVVIDDAVTKDAVLICTLVASTADSARVTRLSTDGGATWTGVATGVGCDLYYIGNKLHPVTIGETL